MKRIHLHALPLRLWHWANALIVIVLLITGFSVRMTGLPALRPHDPVLVIHTYAGWAMTVLYLTWFAYSLASRHMVRNYSLTGLTTGGIRHQARFYLYGIFTGEKNPFRASAQDTFNPLQRITYTVLMFLFVPLIILTGVLFADIAVLRHYLLLWKIAGIVNALHVLVSYVFALFLIVHVYMATLGPTTFSHIRAMITGYEEVPDHHEDPSADSPVKTENTLQENA